MPKALQLIFTACNSGSGTFTQVNAITSNTNVSFGVPVLYTAAILTVLVAIPNLIALLGLSGVVVAETKLYFAY